MALFVHNIDLSKGVLGLLRFPLSEELFVDKFLATGVKSRCIKC